MHPLVKLLFDTVEQHGIPLKELARVSGVTRNGIRRWRDPHPATGISIPNIANLEACLQAVGVTLQPVVTGKPIRDQKPPHTGGRAPRFTPEEDAKMYALRQRGTPVQGIAEIMATTHRSVHRALQRHCLRTGVDMSGSPIYNHDELPQETRRGRQDQRVVGARVPGGALPVVDAQPGRRGGMVAPPRGGDDQPGPVTHVPTARLY